VRIVYRDYPLPIHPSAPLAALSSRCAAEQGQFWPMYDRLFATHQIEWGGMPTNDRSVLIGFAVDLGLDTNTFERCLDDPAQQAALDEEIALAESLGVNSTPNFIINGTLIRGALPFSTFQRAIEEALTTAPQSGTTQPRG
jgi:protein-disulfide isomerase